jgi:hypothetical protein
MIGRYFIIDDPEQMRVAGDSLRTGLLNEDVQTEVTARLGTLMSAALRSVDTYIHGSVIVALAMPVELLPQFSTYLDGQAEYYQRLGERDNAAMQQISKAHHDLTTEVKEAIEKIG